MAVLQFVPHDGQVHGYAGPVVDLHDRWLVPPRYVPVDHEDCQMVLRPGELITCHERRDQHFLQWARVNPDFKIMNAAPHPEAALWGR
jgi:hypothetical protein